MKALSQKTLSELCHANPELQTSLLMPTIRAGREVRQNAIRFKNELQEAIDQVDAFETAGEELKKVLTSCESIVQDDDWWQHQDNGLAFFATAQGYDFIQLPETVEERVFTGTVPYIRPLIKAIQDDSRFHVLAVSQNRVRLLKGDKTSVQELDPTELPKDLRSALAIDEYQSSLQHHSGDKASGQDNAIFHGHGGSGMEVHKNDELRLYFQKLNKALENEPKLESLPLFFAGVEYLFPIFRETSDHKLLMPEPLTGNPDEESPESLRDRAWSVLQREFETRQQELIQQIDITGESDTTSVEIEEILQASQQGAVDTLLISEDEHIWGVFDDTRSTITSRLERVTNSELVKGAQELLNLAAVRILATGGKVYIHSRRELGGTQKAVAVLRFAVQR